MYALVLILLALLAVAVLMGMGLPTDLEAVAAASAIAVAACVVVAFVFVRRLVLVRHKDDPDALDPIYQDMLRSMTVVALGVAALLVYRGGAFFALATGNELIAAWFRENRLVSAAVTLIVAAAFARKLDFPMRVAIGKWRYPLALFIGGAIFVAVVALARLLAAQP
jgi:hypothetical protein